MEKIVIFGGSFDPIHNGHLKMAAFALEKLGASKVVFIPAKRTNFKNPSSYRERYEMVELAIKNIPNFEVSSIEIDSDREVNYTYDTVRDLREIYKDSELYFLIGGDEVDLLDKWYKIDELSKLIRFVGLSRTDSKIDKRNVERFNVLILEGFTYDVSSTDVRNGSSLDAPRDVIEYIVSHELYFIPKVKKYLTEERYKHSLSVARLAYDISVANGIEPSKSYLAGLLHDVGKYVRVEGEIKDEMDEKYSHYFIDNIIPNWAYHQFIGEKIVREEFKITDRDILNSILYHTTGHENMSDLEKIIFASDKIEPTRGFDSSDLISAMKRDVREGFVTVLDANREFLKSHNSYIKNQDELSDSCYSFYLKER